MRCYISPEGVLHVEPDSPVEQYAIRKWSEEALISVEDLCRNEYTWFRGSKIIVHHVANPKTPDV